MHFIDENFWIAISFVIFLYFAYKPVRKAIIKSLDTRINDIKENISQAEKLKMEAASLLTEIQQEMDNFQNYKKQFLNNTELSTKKLIETRTKEMDLILNHKKDSAMKYIENEKSKATKELKSEFTDNVINIVRNYLIETKNNAVSDEEILNKLIGKNF